jgi:hypothetical protein
VHIDALGDCQPALGHRTAEAFWSSSLTKIVSAGTPEIIIVKINKRRVPDAERLVGPRQVVPTIPTKLTISPG